LWFLNLVGFFSPCIINFTIAIFFSVFFPSSLSLLFLCYNTLFSLPPTLSEALIHSFPCLHCPLLSSPTCYHTTPPSYTLTTY
jgi:hypothetical protein